jgi:restriction system protein
MAIPDFQTLLLPLLSLAGSMRECALHEAKSLLAGQFGLTQEEREELLPSGRQRRFDNRVAWAKVYLEQAGLVHSPKRGRFLITQAGQALLAEKPDKINIALLDRYEKFRVFRNASGKGVMEAGSRPTGAEVSSATPEEELEAAYQSIRTELASELLDKVKAGSPQFFETLVVELLLKMGYGGSRADAGRAIGASGDEGIDGIINEDRLGLDIIYIQAKRWAGTVGRPEIQKFVGALHGKRARKGVFLTTSTFSAEAKEYVAHIDPRVLLIDGAELADYMIDLNLGVTPKATFEIKRIDTDYFSEE